MNSSYLRSYYRVHMFRSFYRGYTDVQLSNLQCKVFNLRSYYEGQCVFGRYLVVALKGVNDKFA